MAAEIPSRDTFGAMHRPSDTDITGSSRVDGQGLPDDQIEGAEARGSEERQDRRRSLLIHGDDDFQCDAVSQGERAHQRIPSPTLEIVKDCGHFPWADQPAAFDAAVDAWFTQVGVHPATAGTAQG